MKRYSFRGFLFASFDGKAFQNRVNSEIKEFAPALANCFPSRIEHIAKRRKQGKNGSCFPFTLRFWTQSSWHAANHRY